MSLSIDQGVNLYGKMLLWIYLLIMTKTCNLYYANFIKRFSHQKIWKTKIYLTDFSLFA